MNTSFARRIFSAFLTLVMAVVMTACATNGQNQTTSLGGGDTLFGTAVVRVDRLVTKTSELEGYGTEIDAIQLGFTKPGGGWVRYFDKNEGKEVDMVTRFHRERTFTPYGEKITLTIVGGFVPSATQGYFAKEIAKLGACKEGAVCDSTIVVNDNNAIATGGVGVGGSANAGASNVANAAALAQQQATLNNSTGQPAKPQPPCKTCTYVPKPVK